MMQKKTSGERSLNTKSQVQPRRGAKNTRKKVNRDVRKIKNFSIMSTSKHILRKKFPFLFILNQFQTKTKNGCREKPKLREKFKHIV